MRKKGKRDKEIWKYFGDLMVMILVGEMVKHVGMVVVILWIWIR